MQSGVYKITNLINTDCYVGSSTRMATRWKEHRQHARCRRHHLYSAMRYYGIDNFLFEVLEECDGIKATLLAREQHYIDTINPVYNIRRIASSNLGSTYSGEAWNKGISWSEEVRQTISAAVRAGLTPERQKKAVDAWIAALNDDMRYRLGNGRRNKPAHNKGAPCSDEQKRRISETLTGKHLGRIPHNRGKKTGPRLEVNKKIAESCKTSEARQQVYENRKGYEWSDEQRAQLSESNKTSDKAIAYHAGRVGKSTAKSTHGHYGITFRNDCNKWCVKIKNKKYGNFELIEDAIIRRDEVVAMLQKEKDTS